MKYSPKTLSDVKGHVEIVSELKEMVKNKNIPNLLLVGPPGCGKTTMWQCLCNDLFGKYVEYCVTEYNASDRRKLTDIREFIKPVIETLPLFSTLPFKVIILEEAEEIMKAAQQALRRMMEPRDALTRFILCCNDDSNIITPIRKSRCRRYVLSPLPLQYMREHLEFIAKSEGLQVEEGVYKILLELTHGDLRGAVNIFQTSVRDNGVTKQIIVDTAEVIDIEASAGALILKALEGDYLTAMDKVIALRFGTHIEKKFGKEIKKKGMAFDDIIRGISRILQRKTLNIPNDVRIKITERLASVNPYDKEIQVASIVAGICALGGKGRTLNVSKPKEGLTAPISPEQVCNCPKCGKKIKVLTTPCSHCGTALDWKQ